MSMRDLIPWTRQEGRNLSPWPTDETGPFASLHREMNRLFDDAMRGFDLPQTARGMTSPGWPRLETSENEHELRITAELPGLEEKDIDLSISDGMLTLRGERKSEVDDKERGYSERFYGQFERRVSLPQGVMEDKCDASFHNGVLTIHLPKSAEARERVRRIPISGEKTTH